MLISIHVDERTHKSRIVFSREPSQELHAQVRKLCDAIDPEHRISHTICEAAHMPVDHNDFAENAAYTPDQRATYQHRRNMVGKAIADLLTSITSAATNAAQPNVVPKERGWP